MQENVCVCVFAQASERSCRGEERLTLCSMRFQKTLGAKPPTDTRNSTMGEHKAAAACPSQTRHPKDQVYHSQHEALTAGTGSSAREATDTWEGHVFSGVRCWQFGKVALNLGMNSSQYIHFNKRNKAKRYTNTRVESRHLATQQFITLMGFLRRGINLKEPERVVVPL